MTGWTSSGTAPPVVSLASCGKPAARTRPASSARHPALSTGTAWPSSTRPATACVFGRLEFNDGELRYIGRIGIHADTDEYEQLLMDWRADAARPFYLATAASSGNVRVRRHIKTRDRTLISSTTRCSTWRWPTRPGTRG